MTPETKHYLFIGGGLILATIIGIIVYKRYEAGASASQAASDQQNADELALLEATATDNPYASFTSGAAGGSTISLGSAGPQQSLAEQLGSLEQLFGFGPPASSSPSTGTGSAPSAPAQPVRTLPARMLNPNPPGRMPQPPARQGFQLMDNAEPQMQLEHEVLV